MNGLMQNINGYEWRVFVSEGGRISSVILA